MIDNFMAVQEYKPWHQVYCDKGSGSSIYLGDASAALDPIFLQQHNILTVVTAAAGMDHISYETPIKHVLYPLLDSKSEDIAKFFNVFYDLMQHSLGRSSVLVHCAAAQSATLVISYIMRKFTYSFRQAIQFVRQRRPTVCPNLGFQRQLKHYEKVVLFRPESGDQGRQNLIRTSQSSKNSPIVKELLPEISPISLHKNRRNNSQKIGTFRKIEHISRKNIETRSIGREIQPKILLLELAITPTGKSFSMGSKQQNGLHNTLRPSPMKNSNNLRFSVPQRKIQQPHSHLFQPNSDSWVSKSLRFRALQKPSSRQVHF